MGAQLQQLLEKISRSMFSGSTVNQQCAMQIQDPWLHSQVFGLWYRFKKLSCFFLYFLFSCSVDDGAYYYSP